MCKWKHEEQISSNLPGSAVENPSSHFFIEFLQLSPNADQQKERAKRIDASNDAKVMMSHVADDRQVMPVSLFDCCNSEGGGGCHVGEEGGCTAAAAAATGPCSCWAPGLPLFIQYITWNLAGIPPKGIESLVTPSAHIIAVATQENGGYVTGGSSQDQWEKDLESTCLNCKYKMVACHRLMALHLAVLARSRDVSHYIGHVQVSQVKTGALGGALGNKGGVAIAFTIAAYPTSVPTRCDRFCQLHPQVAAAAENAVSLAIAPPSEKRRLQTSLCFIAAHLTAHQENTAKRNEDYLRIVQQLEVGRNGAFPQCVRSFHPQSKLKDTVSPSTSPSLPRQKAGTSPQEPTLTSSHYEEEASAEQSHCESPRPAPPPAPHQGIEQGTDVGSNVTDDFDVCFFGGDLNYRINGTKHMIEHIIANIDSLRAVLVHNDQLSIEKRKGIVFKGFDEGALAFAPTYKLQKKSDGVEYDKGKNPRLPAYTDRILYKKHIEFPCAIELRKYLACRTTTSSDHRPVVALFSVGTTVPLLHPSEVQAARGNWSEVGEKGGEDEYLAPQVTKTSCC